MAEDSRGGTRQDTAHRSGGAPEIAEERRVTDLETLRVLTDPLRLAILGAFDTGVNPRPMTVKEIAEVLDEGQTKLYRHIKQLEDSGLIHVAETRVVSGIIEKRYRPSQIRLIVESDLLRLSQAADDYNDTLVSLLEATRATLSADLRAGRVVLKSPEHGGTDMSIKISGGKTMMTPEQFTRVRNVLTDLVEEMEPYSDDPEAVPVMLQVLLYAIVEPPAQNTENPPSTNNS